MESGESLFHSMFDCPLTLHVSSVITNWLNLTITFENRLPLNNWGNYRVSRVPNTNSRLLLIATSVESSYYFTSLAQNSLLIPMLFPSTSITD